MNIYINKSQTDTMKIKEQLITHFQTLTKINQELSQAIEKYRQETEYACLKTGIADWPSFLAAIRTGKIAAVAKDPHQSEGSAMALLNGLFENASTSRSTGRQPFCECESPVCSQGSIHRVKGSDTSRSESEEVSSKKDPFEMYKLEIEPKKKMEEESVQQILRYIEQYEQQKTRPLEGFDTFRKPENDDALNDTSEHALSSDKHREGSSTRQPEIFEETTKLQQNFKPFWKNKENLPLELHEWKPSTTSNEYMLAMENTKLRKQLRELEARFLL